MPDRYAGDLIEGKGKYTAPLPQMVSSKSNPASQQVESNQSALELIFLRNEKTIYSNGMGNLKITS